VTPPRSIAPDRAPDPRNTSKTSIPRPDRFFQLIFKSMAFINNHMVFVGAPCVSRARRPFEAKRARQTPKAMQLFVALDNGKV
jgi:hypothetical protein